MSARTGLRSVRIALPRSLRLRIARGRALGSLRLGRAGLPDVSFGLAGRRTRFNGVAVSLTRRGLNVTGLPDDVGVIRLALRRGVLRGRGGTVRVRSALMGGAGSLVRERPGALVALRRPAPQPPRAAGGRYSPSKPARSDSTR